MQYQVPKFIEIESKIIGPLTLKQFIYLLIGAGICAIFYLFLELWLVIILGIFIMGFCATLAFLKINSQPFPQVLKSMLHFGFGPKKYYWKKKK